MWLYKFSNVTLNVGRLPMAGIKSAACREPPRNVCYFDVTCVVILIHT